MANEVTYDPAAGEAFVSHNGQPVEEAPEARQSRAVEQEVAPSLSPDKPEEIETPETEDDDLDDLTDVQRESLDYWKSMGIDAKEALKWCDTDECPFSPETYERFGPLLNDSDPETVKLAVGLISWAKQSPDHFDFKDEYYGVSFSEEQQHELADAIGEEYASEIVNLNYKLTTDEITREQAIRYVASKPKLRNAYLKAAKAELLLIHI